jgi:hypothetical protein
MNNIDFESVYFSEKETFVKMFTGESIIKGGRLLLLVEFPDNPGAEDSISENIWQEFRDTYERSDTDDIYLSFEDALKSMNDILVQESKKRENESVGRFNALAMVMKGVEVHFAQAGLAELFLLRKERLLKISEETSEEIDEYFTSVSSGEITPEDQLFVTTRQYGLDESDIKRALQNDRTEKELKTIGKDEDLIGGCAFIAISKALEEKEEVKEEDFNDLEVREETIIEEYESEEKATPSKEESLEMPIKRDSTGRFMKKVKGAIPKDALRDVGKASAKTLKKASENIGKLIRKPALFRNVHKRYVIAGIFVIIILFGFGLIVQSGLNEEKEQAQHYETLLMEVKSSISVAEQRYLIGEKSDAQEFLKKAETMLEEIETGGFYQKEVIQYQTDIEDYRDSFDGVIRIRDPFVLADVGEKGSVDALGIIHTQEEKNFVYEPRRLFETILEKVQDPLEIDSEEIVIAGWEFEDQNALVFMTQSGRVIEYKNGRFEFVGTADPAWQKGVELKTYSSFLYILDPGSGKIWKYPRSRSRYGNASVYNVEADVSKAVSMAIDGNIYVLSRGGEIQKFNKGELQDFTIKDHPSKLPANATRIFTHIEASNLYVLDPENSRVIVYSKDTRGVSRYQKQYIFETLQKNEMRDFYIDKAEQKLHILTADKVYLTDL